MSQNPKTKLFLFRTGKFISIASTCYLCHWVMYADNTARMPFVIIPIAITYAFWRWMYLSSYFSYFKGDAEKYIGPGFSIFTLILVSILVYSGHWPFMDEFNFITSNKGAGLDYFTAKEIHSGYGPVVVLLISIIDFEIIKQEIYKQTLKY